MTILIMNRKTGQHALDRRRIDYFYLMIAVGVSAQILIAEQILMIKQP